MLAEAGELRLLLDERPGSFVWRSYAAADLAHVHRRGGERIAHELRVRLARGEQLADGSSVNRSWCESREQGELPAAVLNAALRHHDLLVPAEDAGGAVQQLRFAHDGSARRRPGSSPSRLVSWSSWTPSSAAIIGAGEDLTAITMNTLLTRTPDRSDRCVHENRGGRTPSGR